MAKGNKLIRITAIILLAAFMHMSLAPASLFAQSDCPYDKANPTLENARISFKTLNYKCAEAEVQDFLAKPDISLEDRASAHVLLAAVYYAKLKDESEKREQVIQQFKKAFESYREWEGELDITSSRFIDLMKEAQQLVDEEAKEEEEEQPAEPVIVTPEEEKPEPTPAYVDTGVKESKPWYKKWWAIGLGVGIVAGAVVLLAGGGDDDEGTTPDGALPDFPDRPPDKKK
jgi:hypothetical protein